VARTGSQAPGTASGVNFSWLYSPVLNDAGQVAFRGDLIGSGVDSSNNAGIWIGDGSDTLMVVRKGQLLAGKTVGSVSYEDGSGGSGGRALNEFAQLAYHASFTDGSRGVFLYTPDVRWRRSYGSGWDYAGNWTISIPPAAVHRVYLDPAVSLTVTGPTGAVTVRSLQIGGGNGIATLRLDGGTITNLEGTVEVKPTGVLTGDGTISGGITNYGTVLAENLTITAGLFNQGLISGDGRINAAVHNGGAGEISVSAGQQLRLTRPGSANSGQIDVLGGTLRSDYSLLNHSSGRILARNGVLRIIGGLANAGTLGLSFGTSDVFGSISNSNGGQIIVSGNSNATFYNSIYNYSGAEIRVSAGATAVFFGGVTGAGAFTGGGTKFFEGGLSVLGSLVTDGSTNVVTGASLIADRIDEQALAISGSVMLNPGNAASRIGELLLEAPGRLDLADNELRVRRAALAQVRQWLRDGYAGGSWSGEGILSSVAAVDPALWLGYRQYESTGAEILLALGGDATFTGSVGVADLNVLAQNWMQPGRYWTQGDFNYDGLVDVQDLLILARNWGAGGTGPTMSIAEAMASIDTFSGIQIPEPGPAGLMLAGVGLLLSRRRR
jgi:hypothetical protein